MHYESKIQQSIEALKEGLPIILATDTVFGLAVSLKHAKSPDILYKLKGRPSNIPIPCLISNRDALKSYVSQLSEDQIKFAKTHWPGANTLIFEVNGNYPKSFQSSQDSVGFRIPKHNFCLELIDKLGSPLACTSANLHGQDATNSYEKIDSCIKDKVFCPLPVDTCGSNQPSKIFDLRKLPFKQLR